MKQLKFELIFAGDAESFKFRSVKFEKPFARLKFQKPNLPSNLRPNLRPARKSKAQIYSVLVLFFFDFSAHFDARDARAVHLAHLVVAVLVLDLVAHDRQATDEIKDIPADR